MEFITNHWQEIMIAVPSVIAAASAIARITPTRHDDEVVNFILKVVNVLALNKAPK